MKEGVKILASRIMWCFLVLTGYVMCTARVLLRATQCGAGWEGYLVFCHASLSIPTNMKGVWCMASADGLHWEAISHNSGMWFTVHICSGR